MRRLLSRAGKACTRSRRGATLVELLVTFALLAIFLMSAAAVLTPATRVYLNLKYQSYAQSVSDILLERVCGQIASASADEMVISDDGGKISFSDSKASPMYIALSSSCVPDEGNEDVASGFLLLHYRTIYYSDDGSRVLWNAVNWKYDLNAYQGFEIESIHFEPVGDAKRAVKVELTLAHTRFNVRHTASRIVECYNLDQPVSTGTVYTDDDAFWEAQNDRNN